jgi:hypothetical protein
LEAESDVLQPALGLNPDFLTHFSHGWGKPDSQRFSFLIHTMGIITPSLLFVRVKEMKINKVLEVLKEETYFDTIYSMKEPTFAGQMDFQLSLEKTS